MRASAALKSALLSCCLVLASITAAGCSNGSPTTPSSYSEHDHRGGNPGNLSDAHGSSASLDRGDWVRERDASAKSRFAGVTVRVTGTNLSAAWMTLATS